MTPLRTLRAIENDILALKEAFDSRYLEGEYSDRYSRMSLQRQWAMLNDQVAPLVDELHETEKYMQEIAREYEWREHTKSRWNIKRKVKAA